MEIADLDDDEFDHLVLWLATSAIGEAPIDLNQAPAWRFALIRKAVESGEIHHFIDFKND